MNQPNQRNGDTYYQSANDEIRDLALGLVILLVDRPLLFYAARGIVAWLYGAQRCYRRLNQPSWLVYLALNVIFSFMYRSQLGERGMLQFAVIWNSLFGLFATLAVSLFKDPPAETAAIARKLIRSHDWAILKIMLLWKVGGYIFGSQKLLGIVYLRNVAFIVALVRIVEVPLLRLLLGETIAILQRGFVDLQSSWQRYHRINLDKSIPQGEEGWQGVPHFSFEDRLGPREIRLLKIERQDLFKPPVCRLVTQNLDAPLTQKLSFSALSYVHGSPEKTERLTIVNSRGMRTKKLVAKSVYEVILRQASILSSSYVWIDSLCINHDNSVEKSEQVTKMGEIFSSAFIVHGYLDYSLQRNFYMTIEMLDRFQRESKPNRRVSTFLARQQVSNFDGPWSSRTWAIFEAVLASKIEFVNGSTTTDTGCWDVAMEGLESFDPTSINSLDNILDDERPERFSRSFAKAVRMYRLRKEISTKGKLPLDVLLSRYGDFETSERRDKIFAFVGLAKPDHAQIVPLDYGVSTRDIFTKTMRGLIKTGQNLDILAFAGLSQLDRLGELPTWVSCWTAPSTIFELGESPIFKAGFGGTREFPGWSNEEEEDDSRSLDTLKVPAKNIDTVKQLGEVYEIIMSDKVSKTKAIDIPTHHIFTEAWQMAVKACMDNYPDRNSLIKAFWKLLSLNTVRRFAGPDNDKDVAANFLVGAIDTFDKYYNMQGTAQSAPFRQADRMAKDEPELFSAFHAKVHSVIRSLAYTLVGNRFGVTENGRMGIFPAVTQPGDTVHLIATAQVPFVFRRKSGEDSSGRLLHELVGPCQLQGAMDGELNDGSWDSYTLA